MKRTARTVVVLITIAAAVVFVFTFIRAVFYAPDSELTVPGGYTQRELPPSESPARLTIPRLGIDTDIQHVGVNARGNMAVPSNFTDVAWYKLGTVPGQMGSAVIDGHVDNGLGLPGVFKDLGELSRGDDIFIVTKTGRTLHFKVEERMLYGYTAVPLERLFTRADRPRLNLVTCDGAWVKDEKTYDQRLVVYAIYVGET